MGILLVLRLTQVSIRKGSEWGSPSFPSHSSQLQALSPSETGRNQRQPSRHLATEPTAEAPVPLAPRVTFQDTLSMTTPLPPWDPSYQANAGSQLVGPNRGSAVSLSGRTLCHPSWPMYDDYGRIPTTSGHPEEERVVSRDTGLPVKSCEEVFLLDPLLLPGQQRVPLCLPNPPQQAVDPRRLLLPPPIMSSSVHPSSSRAHSSTWLSEAEMIALAGLLQMSQGEQTPNSQASSLPSTSCPDPGSEDPGPSGGQSCSGSTNP
ncbi:histone deacetylase complex subunit SAP25 [Grammomys surdaster]|uniref:histone deacetylase complex subunit SAP25 n=1 Tax=Grammomys surdaster TaxID=491861 RepID=UPI0010A06D52|nr:histone deacetylase complex subunit SAP25 [Grammomys surdaster]